MYEIREWSYERRLKFLNLPSLKYRRYRRDLIQIYKIIHSIDDLKTEDFFTVRNDTNTRSMNVNVYIKTVLPIQNYTVSVTGVEDIGIVYLN